MRRRLTVVGLCLALLAGLLVAGFWVWQRSMRSDFSAALSSVDAGARRVTFTDWAQVRSALEVDAASDPASWMERAYERDLIAGSSMDEGASAMQRHFGFSPANVDWEAFAQGADGAAMVVKVPGDTDFDSLARHLDEAGFTRPKDHDGVWVGGVDLIAELDPTLTPEVQTVALLQDEGLVVTSDTREYAAQIVDVIHGDRDSLADRDESADVVSRVGSPDTAVLWTGDFACEDLSMSRGGEDAQTQAEQLIAEAGKVDPMRGVVMALRGRKLTVALQFESSEQAETNLRSRAKLAVGPAVGRGEGTFADDLRLDSAKTHDGSVVLGFEARHPDSFPLSSLYDGPVLFATC